MSTRTPQAPKLVKARSLVFDALHAFYGASCRTAPKRCPMCGGSTWEYERWRPFFALMDDIAPNHSLLRESEL